MKPRTSRRFVLHQTRFTTVTAGFFSAVGMFALFCLILTAFATSAQAKENSKKKETVEHEAGFYYVVKKGDTLWDLSKKFSDNPWLWPQLWKENDQISNPHRIFPGERIRIYGKDWIDRMEEAQKKASVSAKKANIASKPATATTPEFTYLPINTVGFIRKTEAPSFGTIFKVQDPKAMISEGDVVYIRPTGTMKMDVGRKYTIFRTTEPLEDSATKTVYGIQHIFAGVVKITDMESDYAIGTIVKSYRAIRVGDKLMLFEPKSPEIALTQSVPGLTGTIITAEDHQALVGSYTVAFIDKGADQGVKKGQRYHIYYTENADVGASHDESKSEALKPIDIGTFIVLHTEATTATVLIIHSTRSIAAGSRFGLKG